jgi:hypothetical protein
MLTGARGSMVEVLGYKPEGRGLFPVSLMDFSVYTNILAAVWPWGRQPLTDMSTMSFPEAKRVFIM